MMTTLMMLLGLSGAGAGLYNVLKEEDTDQDKQSKGERGRKRGDSASKKKDPRNQGKRGEEPQDPGWGGRGDELPIKNSQPSKGIADLPPLPPMEGESQDFGFPSLPPVEAKESKSPSASKPLPAPPSGAPQVSLKADEIISRNSKYSFHRRPLQNAEALVEQNQLEEAIQIYQRTQSRISDEGIQEKIQSNIDSLNSYRENMSPPRQGPLGIPGGGFPSGAPGPMGDFSNSLKSITENLAQTLAQAVQAGQNLAGGMSGPGGMSLPPVGQLGSDFLQPAIYQYLKDTAPHPSYTPPQNPRDILENYTEELNKMGRMLGPIQLPSPNDLAQNLEQLNKQALAARQNLRNIADIPIQDDVFFSKGWKDFRNLPLTDRRSGFDRRKNPDSPEFLGGRKDRRSGVDRRKKDLFEERETFLKEKSLEKLKEEAEEAQFPPSPNLNEILEPYLPKEPIKLDLPSGMELRSGEMQEALKDLTHESLSKIALPDPELPREDSPDLAPKINLPEPIDPSRAKEEVIVETEDPLKVELVGGKRDDGLLIGLPDPVDPKDLEEDVLVEGNLDGLDEGKDIEDTIAEEPEKVIHGVLELKPPEADDAPFLTLTYDFGKIPHAFRLSKNYAIMEYSYYKYKPLLMKAQEFARRKMLKNALNYYRVIKSQNIPPELRKMINRNIRDITEFMEKFLMAKGS